MTDAASAPQLSKRIFGPAIFQVEFVGLQPGISGLRYNGTIIVEPHQANSRFDTVFLTHDPYRTFPVLPGVPDPHFWAIPFAADQGKGASIAPLFDPANSLLSRRRLILHDGALASDGFDVRFFLYQEPDNNRRSLLRMTIPFSEFQGEPRDFTFEVPFDSGPPDHVTFRLTNTGGNVEFGEAS